MLSKATISRVPVYLSYIRKLPAQVQSISATAVAKELMLGEVQVRKDLAAVCGKGKPKIGYSVADLSAALESALGVHAKSEAIIIGAGKLGMALLGFGGFSDYEITVRYAFDPEARKHNDQVLPMEQLPAYCQLHQVEMGILCVPTSAAQEAADLLVKNGVKAIWCFAVCHLHVPPEVTVQYENLALSLAHLKSKAIHHLETEVRSL